jgi:hypothetical protein
MKEYMQSEIEIKNLLREVTENIDNEKAEEEDGQKDDWMIVGDRDTVLSQKFAVWTLN